MDQQEGGNSSMFDFDMSKEYSIPIDIKLRTLRIRRHPVQTDDSLIWNLRAKFRCIEEAVMIQK